MPGDSIIIYYRDSSYTYSGQENLPAGLDTNEFLKQWISTHVKEAPEKSESPVWLVPVGLLLILLIVLSIIKIFVRDRPTAAPALSAPLPILKPAYQAFKGTSLDFDPALLHYVLTRFFNYYQKLVIEEKQRFIRRLDTFLRSKTYTIPAYEGYREMPILISASAIQLTFGLKDYMLPWYEYILVHTREYIMVNPLRTLAGNVSGKTITLSWKHFLEDYQKEDGVNVGLHEMAHALQMQHEYFYKRKGEDFRKVYDLFESMDEHIRKQERLSTQRIYTEYALTNTDEFWACSVELFFEQPWRLKLAYPQVYTIMKTLLKQDLALSTSNPCIEQKIAQKKPG